MVRNNLKVKNAKNSEIKKSEGFSMGMCYLTNREGGSTDRGEPHQ